MDYFNKMVSLGFLPHFIELYFNRMLNLGFTQNLAYEFLIKIYKENTKNGDFTNVYDVIEIAKKSNLTFKS